MPASPSPVPGDNPVEPRLAATWARSSRLRRSSLRSTDAAPGTIDDFRQRYVIACAAITTAAQLLKDLHAVAATPHAATETRDLAMLRAASQARSAAGAMSVVAGRLLTLVRENDQQLLPGLPEPVRRQTGVTVPDLPEEEWRTTVRSLASAAAECDAALASCQAAGFGRAITESLGQLQRLADLIVDLLDPSA